MESSNLAESPSDASLGRFAQYPLRVTAPLLQRLEVYLVLEDTLSLAMSVQVRESRKRRGVLYFRECSTPSASKTYRRPSLFDKLLSV